MNSPEKTTYPNQTAQKHITVDPNLLHFMGIQMNVPIRKRKSPLFDKNPVRYKLADPTNPGKTRILTMYGEFAVLDGEACSAINCQHSNKILAQFGSSEVAIQLFPDQLGGTGLIRTKGKEGVPDAVTPIVAFTEPGMMATISVQKADQTWMENWGSLMVSPDENGQPKASVIMSNNPTEQMPVAVTNDKSGALSFQIWLGSAVSSNGGYLEGDLTMSGNGLQGKMFLQTPNPKYDPDVQGSLKFSYIEVGARAEWQNSNLHEDDLSSLEQKPDKGLNAIDINHPNALWRFLSTDTELSIGELIGMTPPDNNDLHKAVCDGTMNCAILSVQQDWLKDLNLSKPSPLPELHQIATDPKNQEFFQKYFKAMGCSELAVDQMQEGWQSFSDGWQTVQSRMHYFWQGGATGCLARDKDFLRISEEIAQIYFSSMMGAFQRYLKLPQDQRTDWASKLLDAVTTPHMLMRLISSKECEAIHKYIIMLRALDQDGGFDKLFIKRINGAIQTQVANRMGSADITSVEEFLRKVLQHLMDPESDLKGDTFDNLRDDLNDLKENDPTKWVGFTNSMTDLAEELTNIALAYKNVPWQQKLKVWKDRILQKYGGDERMVKVYSETGSLALTAVTVGFSTFALVGEIKEWSNLSPLQKTQTVLGAVQQVGTLGDQVYSFIKFIREPNAPVTVEMDLFRWNGDWDVLPEDAIGSDAYELRMAANAGSIGKYDIAAFAGPLEALTVVVTILSMISLGFQIYNDIEDNEPAVVIAFDILEEVAMFASLLVIPAMAANPILGAVVAVVGIIISIIDSFLPRNPPPIIMWAQNIGTPFVLTIPDPPKDWQQKTQYLNLRVIVREVYPMDHPKLPHAIRSIAPAQLLAANPPSNHHPNASIISLLAQWQDLPEDQKKVVAESIWKSIQTIKTVADSTIADCIIAQVARSQSAGPAFFYESNPQNNINGKDYTAEFKDIGIWVMGYAISSNQYFKNVDGTTCKAKLMPTFQNKAMASDLFLDHLYRTGGFDSFLQYAKPETKIAVLDLILSPGFVPQAFWQHAENLLPCQVLLLVANDLGCDLTEVRNRIKTWNINPSVFDMADGNYNFFQNFLTVPDASFFAYLDSNQDIQNGLASNRPKPAGVSMCNVLSFEVWGDVYTGSGGFGVSDYYQDYNGVYGDPVDQWVMATSDLPHSSPSTNLRKLGSSFLGSGAMDPGSAPIGSRVDPSQIHQPSCFPGDTQVILSTWNEAPVSSLRHGDQVLTLDKKGHYQFSEIFFFGHKDPNAVSWFKSVRTEDGHRLRLSAGHYLPVSNTTFWGDRKFVKGCEVQANQFVRVIPEPPGTQEARLSRVVSVEDCEGTGLYNPYTLNNSTIVVDRVVASTHSDWFLEGVMPAKLTKYIPAVYDACLVPGKFIYRMMGHQWAETLQEEVQIDQAAYGETGFTALIKPYMILVSKVMLSIARSTWLRVRLLVSVPLRSLFSYK